MNSSVGFVCLIGMFLSVLVLYFHKGADRANRYLAGYLFFSAVNILYQYAALFWQSSSGIAVLLTGLPPTYFLIGPLAYLYIRSIINGDARLRTADATHFILFLVMFSGTLPYILSSWEEKRSIAERMVRGELDYRYNILLPNRWIGNLRLAQSALYTGLVWAALIRYRRGVQSGLSRDLSPELKRWMAVFCRMHTLLVITYTALIFMFKFYWNKDLFLFRALPLLQIASVTFLILNLVLVFFPEAIYGMQIPPSAAWEEPPRKEGAPTVHNAPASVPAVDPPMPDANRETGAFNPEYLRLIRERLQRYVENRLYTHPDCSLAHVTLHTELPSHHLTQYFNQVLGQTFFDWRNRRRVEEAIRLIREGHTGMVTLDALAARCGYRARSTFIQAFRKETGMKPSEYLRNLRNSAA